MSKNLIQDAVDRITAVKNSPEYKTLQAQWQEARDRYGLHDKKTLELRDKLLRMQCPSIINV